MLRWLTLALVLLAGSAWAEIPRSRAEVRAFRSESPCPSTGLFKGPCKGWEVDHVQALCSGGADHRSNLQWLSKEDHKQKTRMDVMVCRRLKVKGP